ncbi:MAG: hypothetical protein Q9168_003488 [Polycauliona sp. 1 TL-2023]
MAVGKFLHPVIKEVGDKLYWVPRENEEGRNVYNRICHFYFVMNQPTVKQLQNLIEPGAINKKNLWLTDWLHRYAHQIREWLDSPDFIGEIQTFWDSPPYNMKVYKEPRGGWQDINDRLARDI